METLIAIGLIVLIVAIEIFRHAIVRKSSDAIKNAIKRHTNEKMGGTTENLSDRYK